jgi:hypothetical protein
VTHGSPASNSLPEVAVGARLLRDLKFADAIGQDQRGESVLTGSELGLASACRSEWEWASGSVSVSGSDWELGLESALERL